MVYGNYPIEALTNVLITIESAVWGTSGGSIYTTYSRYPKEGIAPGNLEIVSSSWFAYVYVTYSNWPKDGLQDAKIEIISSSWT